jgi:trehalose 6-phosphate phosphatase
MIDLPRQLGWSALHGRALYLDVDGTLLDIAPRPDAVVVPGALPGALARIAQRLDGALALVSGRQIDTLDRLFHPQRFPTVGVHGAEVRADSVPATTARHFARHLDGARAALAARMTQWPGALLEDKGIALAVHYRDAAALEGVIRETMQRLAARAGAEFTLLQGKFVLELKPAALSKASGISTLRDVAPFANRAPVYLGDDVTDESAFALVNEAQGLSVRVGPPAGTLARYRVDAPATVRAWLHGLADSQEGGP